MILNNCLPALQIHQGSQLCEAGASQKQESSPKQQNLVHSLNSGANLKRLEAELEA
jgi:hypothetical protein